MSQPTQKCGVCQRMAPQPEHRECSHVDCPHRKRATAQPPERLDGGLVPPHINDDE